MAATLDIVRRAEWGAPPVALVRVVPHGSVWIHHTVTGTPGPIVPTMQGLNAIAVGRGFRFFSYSFAVLSGGPDNGRVGEGRGFLHQGAHTLGHNGDLGIALTGNFENVEPTHEALVATANLIRLGLYYGTIRTAAGIGGHRDTGYATACPGRNLYDRLATLRTWVLNGPPGGSADVMTNDQVALLWDAAVNAKAALAQVNAATERLERVEDFIVGRGDDSIYWHSRYLRRELLGDGNYWRHMADVAGGGGPPIDTNELVVNIVSELGPEQATAIAKGLSEILAKGATE